MKDSHLVSTSKRWCGNNTITVLQRILGTTRAVKSGKHDEIKENAKDIRGEVGTESASLRQELSRFSFTFQNAIFAFLCLLFITITIEKGSSHLTTHIKNWN